MQAGRRHLQRTLDVLLALHLGKVGIHGPAILQGGAVARQAALVALRGEMRAHFQQRARRVDDGVGDQGRLVGICLRQHEGALAAVGTGAAAVHGEAHRQRAAHRAQVAGEREFAGEFVAVEFPGRDLLGRGQDAERDRQVEAAGFLGQLGRRQIDGDAPAGHLEARILQRGAHPVLGFADLGVGQAHDVHRRQTVGQVHLDADGGRLHAGQGAAA
jgi:hypothetical protein